MFKEGQTGTEKLPTSDSHVDGENGTKTIVYSTKREDKEKEGEKHIKEFQKTIPKRSQSNQCKP